MSRRNIQSERSHTQEGLAVTDNVRSDLVLLPVRRAKEGMRAGSQAPSATRLTAAKNDCPMQKPAPQDGQTSPGPQIS